MEFAISVTLGIAEHALEIMAVHAGGAAQFYKTFSHTPILYTYRKGDWGKKPWTGSAPLSYRNDSELIMWGVIILSANKTDSTSKSESPPPKSTISWSPLALEIRVTGGRSMFSQLFEYLFGWWTTTGGLTEEDLARFDIAFDEPMTIFDHERVLVEDGEVVGTTAILTDQQKIVPTLTKHPSGVDATFEQDIMALENAVNSTSFVIVEDPSSNTGIRSLIYGTAFFISPKLLLTAGHNTLGRHGPLKHLCITPPGLPYIKFSTIPGETDHSTIDCEVLGTLYTGKRGEPRCHDIAILQAGSYNSKYYLKLSSDVPSPGGMVNVVGYPGQVKQEWLRIHEGLKDVEVSRRATDIMLPAQRLAITSGPVESLGPTVSYKVSTVRGMSGGAVLYKDFAIGVHIGQEIEKVDGRHTIRLNTFPQAVTFTSDEIVKFLKKHKCSVGE